MIKISKFLDPNLVVFLDVHSRDEALFAMVELLKKNGKISAPDVFYHAVIEREKLVSTGIGMGVAIPHAKLSDFDEFFICIGILKNGLDWNALDDAPVRLVFMIGGPDDKQTEYLQILSKITFAIKDEQRRKKVLTLNSSIDIIELFKAF
jgi:nitrogen PTS system EIIA component